MNSSLQQTNHLLLRGEDEDDLNTLFLDGSAVAAAVTHTTNPPSTSGVQTRAHIASHHRYKGKKTFSADRR